MAKDMKLKRTNTAKLVSYTNASPALALMVEMDRLDSTLIMSPREIERLARTHLKEAGILK
ncbi:MAG: hypothetical protein AABW72_03090 [archaeon]